MMKIATNTQKIKLFNDDKNKFVDRKQTHSK